jgi:hypothetical protein
VRTRTVVSQAHSYQWLLISGIRTIPTYQVLSRLVQNVKNVYNVNVNKHLFSLFAKARNEAIPRTLRQNTRWGTSNTTFTFKTPKNGSR